MIRGLPVVVVTYPKRCRITHVGVGICKVVAVENIQKFSPQLHAGTLSDPEILHESQILSGISETAQFGVQTLSVS